MSYCYSIRFPLIKVRTGNRCGPRFYLLPDKAGLNGARACAAGMVSIAIRDRESMFGCAKINRLGMRQSALWARVFAGHISADDPRLKAAAEERRALVLQYCNPAAA